MNYNRKEFLKTSALLAAGLSVSNFVDANSLVMNKSKKEFGIQLYGLRDMMGKDPLGVLKKVAALGYSYIEPHDHNPLGMFYGYKPKEFKAVLKDLGLKIISVHTDLYIDFEKKVEGAAELGLKYFLYGWEGPRKTVDDYKKMAEYLNKKGELCKQHGMMIGFHNHDFTFTKSGDWFPQDILIQNTDKNLVAFQLDFYWALYAGQNPVEWVKKYPGRFHLCHYKDRSKTSTEREGKGIVELGTGSIDFQQILDQIKGSSIKYHIVDQDTCNDRSDPIECAGIDAAFMKKLKW